MADPFENEQPQPLMADREASKPALAEVSEESLYQITGGGNGCGCSRDSIEEAKKSMNRSKDFAAENQWHAEGEAARGDRTKAGIRAGLAQYWNDHAKFHQRYIDIHSPHVSPSSNPNELPFDKLRIRE